jgi:magnesium-transporting ATPase (P-type)
MPIPSGSAEPPTADLCTFIGHCKAEKPEISLEKFDGNFYKSRDDEDFSTLSIEQLVMNGTELKNTEWAIAFCVYTGVDTRIMKNSQDARNK